MHCAAAAPLTRRAVAAEVAAAAAAASQCCHRFPAWTAQGSAAASSSPIGQSSESPPPFVASHQQQASGLRPAAGFRLSQEDKRARGPAAAGSRSGRRPCGRSWQPLGEERARVQVLARPTSATLPLSAICSFCRSGSTCNSHSQSSGGGSSRSEQRSGGQVQSMSPAAAEAAAPSTSAAYTSDAAASCAAAKRGSSVSMQTNTEGQAWVGGEDVVQRDVVFKSPRKFLERSPKGAYTTTRTIDAGTRVLLWDFHVARLIDSFLRLAREKPELFPDLFDPADLNPDMDLSHGRVGLQESWDDCKTEKAQSVAETDAAAGAAACEAAAASVGGALGGLVGEVGREVKGCCQMVLQHVQQQLQRQREELEDGGEEREGGDGESDEDGGQKHLEICIMLLICGSQPQFPDTFQTSPWKDRRLRGVHVRVHATTVLVDSLHSLPLLQLPRSSLPLPLPQSSSSLLSPAPCNASEHNTEAAEVATAAAAAAAAAAVTPPAAPVGAAGVEGVSLGVAVAVMGPGRAVPAAKFSEWPVTRRHLEQCKPSAAKEVLLSNDGDHLLEGLVTNFFVIARRGNAEDAQTAEGREAHSEEVAASQKKQIELLLRNQNGQVRETPPFSWDNVEVVTAPVDSSSGVLPGSIRHIILDVCAENNIRVVLKSPSLKDKQLWLEAFITNALCFLEPVSHVMVAEVWRGGGTLDPWTAQDKWSTAWRLDQHSNSRFVFTSTLMRLVVARLESSAVPIKNLPHTGTNVST